MTAKIMRRLATVLGVILSVSGCAATPIEREQVSTNNAPAAIGPYAQAVRVGGTIYLSGQIALDPSTAKLVNGGIEEQTHQVLRNIREVLAAAGFSLNNVVQSQVFLSDLGNYAAMNEIYASYFEEDPPARAAVQVARLPRDALVEIMVTAARSE